MATPRRKGKARNGNTSPQAVLRAEVVYDLILVGMRRSSIIGYLRGAHDKEGKPLYSWAKNARTVDYAIAKARGMLEETSKTHAKLELGKAIGRLENLYERSYTINDYKACASIVKQLVDLLGLAAAQKFEVEHSGQVEVSGAREALAREIAEHLAAQTRSEAED